MERRLTDLNRYVRGWIGYFGLAQQFDEFVNLDGWIRRRDSDVLLETVATSPYEGVVT